MLQKILLITFCITFPINMAQAKLSANPWLAPNDNQQVEEVYQKQQKRNNSNNLDYDPQEQDIIENVEAPNQINKKLSTPQYDSNNFMKKISNLFNKQDQEEDLNQSQPKKKKSRWWNKSKSSSRSLSSSNRATSADTKLNRLISSFSAKIKDIIQKIKVTIKSDLNTI